MENFEPQHIEGILTGEGANPFAVAAKLECLRPDLLPMGHAHIDQSDGLLGASSVRAGDARGGDRPIGLRRAQGSQGHFAGAFRAYCAETGKRLVLNAQKAMFGLVGIGDI